MVVKIRLARFGRTRAPIYNIVVAQARSARGSKPIEVLGTYDPLPRTPLAIHEADAVVITGAASSTTTTATGTDAESGDGVLAQVVEGQQQQTKPKRYKDIVLDTSRTKYWLGVGAQPSEPVERLFTMMGLLEPRPKNTKTPRTT